MVAFGKRLITAIAYGSTIGSVLYLLASLVNHVIGAFSPIIAFAIGFGSAIAVAFAEDLNEKSQ